jgi:4-hydroxymandelate oxidase
VPSTPINVLEYEAIARQKMEPGAFDYYAGGAEDERTLAANRWAFDQVFLRPRVLVDVSHVDSTSQLLGASLRAPILIAPAAFQALAHADAELATARAAGGAGTVMVVSTVASRSLEEIAAAAGGPLWFQLYVYKDRELTRALVARAEAAGYAALVLTVDTPILGRRERDTRNGFQLPEKVMLANFSAAHPLASSPGEGGGHANFQEYTRYLFDAALDWSVVAWLRSITRLPILLKGILTPEDARVAVEAGVDGIIVSNHGGRQLDGVEPTLRALPRVADAVAGAVPVLMDGGVRRGTDVLKALALGARAVLIGRPFLWGLAAAGEPGVRHVLDLLGAELQLAMALSGRTTLAAVDRSLVVAR